MPAPTAAPLPPSIAPPAAAPRTVPIAALLAVLSLAACAAVVPPTWTLAYCRQEKSSARNWSNVLWVPGSAIMLGPVGTVVQAARANNATETEQRNAVCIDHLTERAAEVRRVTTAPH